MFAGVVNKYVFTNRLKIACCFDVWRDWVSARVPSTRGDLSWLRGLPHSTGRLNWKYKLRELFGFPRGWVFHLHRSEDATNCKPATNEACFCAWCDWRCNWSFLCACPVCCLCTHSFHAFLLTIELAFLFANHRSHVHELVPCTHHCCSLFIGLLPHLLEEAVLLLEQIV